MLFEGWDAEGQPVGMPWSQVRKPLVEIAAVSEDQVDTNTWSPLIDMLTVGPAVDLYPGLEPMAGFVNLPYGRVQKRTAAAGSAKGAPAHFVVEDQTEAWTPGNGGVALHNTLRNNVVKRGGHLLESPNAFTPGMGSVAEASMSAYQLMVEGKTRMDSGLMFDHREAPAETSLVDGESLMTGLRVAYGDSADVALCAIHDPPCERPGWVDLESIRASIWDPDTDEQVSRSDWLNQITHASNAWLSQPEWRAVAKPGLVLADRDAVVLGFDGSRGRAKGKPDATALIGCRVADGHLFQIGVWEADDRPETWAGWEPNLAEIEAAVAGAFARFTVVGFYADPGRDWASYVTGWEVRYGAKVKAKASVDRPFSWWMTGGRSGLVQRAVEQLEGAVRNGDCSHDGSFTLTRHVLAARRRLSHGKLALGKENDYSPRKIDAAVAAVLAWQARLDALAKGVGAKDERRSTRFGRIY